MHNVSKPVKLVFIPLLVEAQYTKSIKFQIAIFRSQVDEKGKRPAKLDKT